MYQKTLSSMESPPPTQVPLRDPLMDVPRSLQPASPSPTDSANNSFGSPSHNNSNNNNSSRDNPGGGSGSGGGVGGGGGNGINNITSSGHRDPQSVVAAAIRERGERGDPTGVDLMSMTNGHSSVLASHAYTLAQAHAHATAMAQLHNHNLMAAHAHSSAVAARHHVTANPMSQLMRKSLMPHKPPPGGPYRSPPPGMGGGGGGGQPPAGPPGVDHNACSLIKYRENQVAAFNVDGRELICLPQAFELFLKDLVGGLHTVYTKLKRLDIQPVVCNVEQVRILRGLGAIQPGVNRCKLISCSEFDVLYEDCTNSNARPGRPPKRNPPSMHASPETIEKLKKTRMDGSDFNYDARYFGVPGVPGDHKSMLNGFTPSPYLHPYLHMNPMMSPPMSAVLAATQFMRPDSVAKDGKAFMDQELLNRQNHLGMFGAPPLGDQHLASRHHEADPNKPMNLSNGNARGSLSFQPPPNVKVSSDEDDDDDDGINDEKLSDDDNDPDMDDNSGDDVSDGYNGSGGDLDKSASTPGRPEVPPQVNGSHAPVNQTPSEVEKMLLNVIELTQKAFNAARVSQVQIGQDKESLQEELLREKELRKQAEKQLEEELKKGEAMERRLRKEKKARRQLQLQLESAKPGSPGSGGHHNGTAAIMPPASSDMGLDLAIKPMSSPEDHTRTQTTDAAESENEGDKHNLLQEPERKLSESSDRGCLRDPFDLFSAAAALSGSSAVTGGSPPVRFQPPYLSLIGSEVQ